MGKNYRNEIKKELEEVEENEIFSKQFKRKKTIIWFVRTIFATVLYYYFWEYNWVKWSLFLYVPLNLFGLFLIYGSSYFLKRKAEKLKTENEL
ncbi:hypothetical protein [Polaribacter sp. Asnod6-C07]|uniref:hypothetical protein n=1 Tax=Polaribacter sp. Asnod6-C07 TaxID=3160582 RepID=UPI00386C70D7